MHAHTYLYMLQNFGGGACGVCGLRGNSWHLRACIFECVYLAHLNYRSERERRRERLMNSPSDPKLGAFFTFYRNDYMHLGISLKYTSASVWARISNRPSVKVHWQALFNQLGSCVNIYRSLCACVCSSHSSYRPQRPSNVYTNHVVEICPAISDDKLCFRPPQIHETTHRHTFHYSKKISRSRSLCIYCTSVGNVYSMGWNYF